MPQKQTDPTNHKCTTNFGSDDFIIGEAANSDFEYVVHLGSPRFIARYWDGAAETFACARSRAKFEINGCLFYDILWIDEEPDLGMQAQLFVDANEAIELYSSRVDGYGGDYDDGYDYDYDDEDF